MWQNLEKIKPRILGLKCFYYLIIKARFLFAPSREEMCHRFMKKIYFLCWCCLLTSNQCLFVSLSVFYSMCTHDTERDHKENYFSDCRRTSVMTAFFLQIPQNKAFFPILIVVDTVWIWLSQMLLKTQNNQHFWTNNLLRDLLPNLAVMSSGRSFNCDSFYKEWVEMKSEGLTYN